MKQLIVSLALIVGLGNAGIVFADGQSDLGPCHMMIANGWQILILRNEDKMTLNALLNQTKVSAQQSNIPENVLQNLLQWITEVWAAPDDGWDWIANQHRTCIREVLYGPGQD